MYATAEAKIGEGSARKEKGSYLPDRIGTVLSWCLGGEKLKLRGVLNAFLRVVLGGCWGKSSNQSLYYNCH